MIFLIFTNSRGLSSFYFYFYSFWKDESGARRTKTHGDEGRNRGEQGYPVCRESGSIVICPACMRSSFASLRPRSNTISGCESFLCRWQFWLSEYAWTRESSVEMGMRWNEWQKRSRKDEESEEESSRVSHPIIVGYESTEPATRPSAAVLLEVLWTAADGSGSQRTNNIVYFSDGSHRRSAFQFAPRGWGCMIHDAGDTGPYFDPSFYSSCFSVPLVPLSFLPSTSLGLELFAQYTPFPFPFLHFRVSVGANAAFNSGIILLLALQILSLWPIFLRGSLDCRRRKRVARPYVF